MKTLLGIDYGTGGCKVTALGTDGSFVGEASVEYTTYHDHPGWSEQEPPDCDFVKAPYPGGDYLARFPQWFKAGMSARPSKNRACFADWNYFTKDSKLVPSGLLEVRFGHF